MDRNVWDRGLRGEVGGPVVCDVIICHFKRLSPSINIRVKLCVCACLSLCVCDLIFGVYPRCNVKTLWPVAWPPI